MAAIRWGIPSLLLVICVIGQYAANAWPVVIQRIGASGDGHLFALVHSEGVYGAQLIRWNRDLSQRTNLFELSQRDSEIRINHDGTLVACVNRETIVAYEVRTGRRLWSKNFGRRRWRKNFAGHWITMPVADGRSLLVVKNIGTLDQIAICDFATGDLISEVEVDAGTKPQHTPNVFLDPDRVTLLNEQGQYRAYRVVDDRIQAVDETVDTQGLGKLGTFFSFARIHGNWADKPIANVALADGKQLRATRGSAIKPCEIWVEDPSTGETLHSDTLKISTTRRDVLNSLTAFLTFALMMLWRIDRLENRPNKPRFIDLSLLIDLVVLGGLMTLPYLVYHGTLVPDEVVSAQPARFFAIAMGIVVPVAFFAMQLATRPFYRWAIALFFCIFPFLIPTIIAVILIWNTRTSHLIRQRNSNTCTDDSKKEPLGGASTGFRFGISEMLGATAAIALLMGVGRLSFEFIGQGVGVAVWFLVAFMLSCQAIPAAITMLICLFFLGFEDPRPDEAVLALLAVTTTMTFCWLRLMNHLGSVVGNQKQEQPPELAEC